MWKPFERTRIVVCSHMTSSISRVTNLRGHSQGTVSRSSRRERKSARKPGRRYHSTGSFVYEELPRISGISWCSQEDRSDATPNWVSSSHHYLRRRTLLTETRLCDEVPGHGEHMFLVCLVIADGFGIHFGFILPTVHTRTLSTTVTDCHCSLRRIAEGTVLRRCAVRERERDVLKRTTGGEGMIRAVEYSRVQNIIPAENRKYIMRDERKFFSQRRFASWNKSCVPWKRLRKNRYVRDTRERERRMEDEARAITWLGLRELLNVRFERNWREAIFGAQIKIHEIRKSVDRIIHKVLDNVSNFSILLDIEWWKMAASSMRGDSAIEIDIYTNCRILITE